MRSTEILLLSLLPPTLLATVDDSCLQPPCPENETPHFKGYGAAVLVNPLKGLPPLPKYHHMSGTYETYTYNASFNGECAATHTRQLAHAFVGVPSVWGPVPT